MRYGQESGTAAPTYRPLQVHQITKERTGFGLDGSTTPRCSCGWSGFPVYETDGAKSSRLNAQEQQHLRGGAL